MSNEEIARRISIKVDLHIRAYLPKPECSSKHQQWKWQVESIKKKVAEQLYPGGLNISIDVS